MEYFSFEQQRVLLFVTLTCVTVILAGAWAFLIALRGCGMWNWLDPKPARLRRDYHRAFLSHRQTKRRTSVELDMALCDSLDRLLADLAPDPLTITDYIGNIIADHLERHADTIGGLLEEHEPKTKP
jgi:hypothetical protein